MNRLTRISLAAYGALALPLAFSGLPIYVYASDLYTTHYGVPLGIMGIFLLGIRLLDAIQDPIIGTLSDRWHRWRFSFICGGLLVLAVSFIMLYNPPVFLPALPWFVTCMVLAAFGFSTVSINYNALGSLWRENPGEKTSVVASREGLGLLGLLLATLTPAFLRLRFSSDVAFQIYSIVFASLAVLAFIAFSAWHRSSRQQTDRLLPAKRAKAAVWPLLRQPFASLFIVYGLSTLASSIPGVLVVFFIRDRLQAESLTGPFLALYFLAGIAGMPLWNALARRIGKKRSWRLAMLLSLLSFVGAYWLRAGDIVAYGSICFSSGLALGAELIMPLSIASDLIDRCRQQALTSIVFAILLFMSKLSLALASAAAFLLLAHSLYVPGELPSSAAASTLSIVYALIPSAIKLLAVIISHFLPEDGLSGKPANDGIADGRGDTGGERAPGQIDDRHEA